MSDEPTHLDLFSGIGGFSLAFEAEGFRTIGFSEIDPYACAVLKKHWPDVPNYGDIGLIPRGTCDVITGGFPCQPFSVAGKRGGQNDDRYLWPAMLRVISSWGPSWVCCENVPGIVGMELCRVLADLEAVGFQSQTFIVPACGIGAQHLRNRVWVIAHAAGVPLEESQVVLPARPISEPRESAVRLSRNLWEPHRETYLAEMAGDIHGLSNWVDRSKALGNSIVPQVAQIFARAIYREITQ